MYGLDKNEDLSFLLGKELGQVGFGLYYINLNFDDGVNIGLSCGLNIEKTGKVLTKVNRENLKEAKELIGFLGKTIKGVINQGKGTLYLEFSDGFSLKIFDDSENYESYSINSKNKSIIV